MHTLSLMPNDDFKVGDYVYIIEKLGVDLDGGTSVNFKKKLSTQDIINLKLGIPYNTVCPGSINEDLYKIRIVHKHFFDSDLIKKEDFGKML